MRTVVSGGPGWRFLVFGGRHFERGDLLPQYRHRLDGHRHRAPEPPEPSAVGNDQLDLAFRTAHDLLDMPERDDVIIQHRQSNEIINLDLLGESSRHLVFMSSILRKTSA